MLGGTTNGRGGITAKGSAGEGEVGVESREEFESCGGFVLRFTRPYVGLFSLSFFFQTFNHSLIII